MKKHPQSVFCVSVRSVAGQHLLCHLAVLGKEQAPSASPPELLASW